MTERTPRTSRTSNPTSAPTKPVAGPVTTGLRKAALPAPRQRGARVLADGDALPRRGAAVTESAPATTPRPGSRRKVSPRAGTTPAQSGVPKHAADQSGRNGTAPVPQVSNVEPLPQTEPVQRAPGATRGRKPAGGAATKRAGRRELANGDASATLPRGRASGAGSAKHDLKREQILDAAVNLFFRHGYAGTTIADIADKLGVTKPFVYYYFENKEELFETLAWEAANACLTTLQFPADDSRPAIDRLREGLHKLVVANLNHLKAATFHYRETGVLRAPFQRKLRTLGRRFLDDLCALLEAGRRAGDLEFDNARLTALAMGSIVGFMYAWYRPNGPLGPDDLARQLSTMMLQMAGAKAPRASRGKARTNP